MGASATKVADEHQGAVINGRSKGESTRHSLQDQDTGFMGQTNIFSDKILSLRAKIMSHISRARIPQGLSSEQRHIYQVLLQVSAARAKKDTPHIVIITDLAKDYDDLAAMVVLKELHRLGLVYLDGFVANLTPAKRRACFGRGALDSLGLEDVPITYGLDAAENPRAEMDYEFNCSFMAPEDSVLEDGETLLLRLCRDAKAKNRKFTLLCLSPLEDIAHFAEEHPVLLNDVLGNVVLQGGYTFTGGLLRPDPSAANNHVHMKGAESFHLFMQQNNIPSVVYTKDAAFATPMTSDCFAALADTKHPVGEHLRYVQVEQDVQFYERACLPKPERFAPFYDQEYFLRKRSTWFDTHSDMKGVPTGRGIIPYLGKVIIYDALAALGAGGWDMVNALKVVHGLERDTQQPIHKIVAGEDASPGVYGNPMATALSALLLGSLLAVKQNLQSSPS